MNVTIVTMVCVSCFTNEGLRRIAAHRAEAPRARCTRCGDDAAPLTNTQVEEVAYEFFRSGSVPTRSQFGVEKFRTIDYPPHSEVRFRSSLAADCELLASECGIYVVEYEPSPLWRIGCGDLQLAIRAGGEETEAVLRQLVAAAPNVILPAGSIFYRARLGAVTSSPGEFDSPPPGARKVFGRFDCKDVEVLYGAFDMETCLHELRITIVDEVTMGTLRTNYAMRLADLTSFPTERLPHESLDLLCHTICLGGESYYPTCRRVATALRTAGFEGFIYKSYFSLVKSAEHKNIALFGRPLQLERLTLQSVNSVAVRKISYKYDLGPATVDQAVLQEPAG